MNKFKQQDLRLVIPLALMASASVAIGQSTPMNQGSFWTPPASPPPLVVNLSTWYSSQTQNQAPDAWQQTSSPWMAPNPNMRPTTEQTQWYVNHSPYFENMDPGTKQAIIYSGPGSGLLSGSYLPNGSPNPFYQQPNWYVPSSWSSSQMNWQGVQPNGYLPATMVSGYNYWSNNTTQSSYSYHAPTVPSTTYQTYQTYQSIHSSNTMESSAYSSSPATLRQNAFENSSSFQSSHPRELGLNTIPKSINEAGLRALHESADDKVAEAIDHSELAGNFLQRDNPQEALIQVGLADRLAAAAGNPLLEIDLLRIKAAALMSSGEFEEALAAYRDMMGLLRLQHDELGQAETFASVGWAFQSLGKVTDAINTYGDAFTVFQRVKNTNGEARALIGLGSLYGSMGDYEKAREMYRAAVPLASDDLRARILVSYAGLLQAEGSPWVAFETYLKAFSLIHSNDKVLLGATLAGMGRSEMALEQYDDARTHLENAAANMENAGDRRGEAGVMASIADLNYWTSLKASLRSQRKPNFSQALAGYTQALALMRETGDRQGEIGVLTDMGRVFEVQGKLSEAVAFYNQALTKLEDLRTSARLEEFRIDEANQSQNLYSHVVGLETHMHHMDQVFNLSERARARTFLDLLGNSRLNARRAVPDEFAAREETLRKENILLERQIGQEFSKPLPDVDANRMRSLQERLVAVNEKYQRSIEELKISNPQYASFLSVSPLTVGEAQQQLGPGVTSLSYFTLPDMTLAFVLTKDNLRTFKLPVKEGELRWAISTLYDFAGESEPPPALKMLYKCLIAPLRSALNNHTLLISPYGVLHDVPFAALSQDGKSYLIDSYSITVLPSISAWPYLHAKREYRSASALVLASDDVQGFPHLGGGHDEAEAVASMFGSKPLFGREAAVSTLQKHGGEYSIVHLMAHLDHDEKNPRSSRIVLAQDLDLNEVLDLDLRNTNLVVLSGCQSQKGERTRGDDVIALSRAFMYAGAPSVIASLWDVDDEATRQLMVAFYSHLIEGHSKAEALQAAQQDVRRNFPNPYYWASFVLMGDPGVPGNSAATDTKRSVDPL